MKRLHFLLLSYYHKICELDSHTFPNELDRKFLSRRNANFLMMQVIFLKLLILYVLFIKSSPTFTDYWNIFIFLIILIVFCLTCRSDSYFFTRFFSIITTIGLPLALYIDPQGIYSVWVSVYLTPLFLLHYTSCRLLYGRQVIIQILLLNFVYKHKMTEIIDFTRSEDFMHNLASATSFAVIVTTFMVNHVGNSLQNTFKQEIELGEAKRRELEVQKTFILSFSHEIRNLINNLIGNVQLTLLEEISGKAKYYLKDAEIGAGMLIQLINNILDTGNLEVGELDLNPSNQIIHSTLEKMWRMCAYLLKAKNLKGQLQISRNLPRNLTLDHERFSQILVNLVVNAVKFTEKGSIDIKIEWIKNESTVSEDSFFPSPFDEEGEGVFEKNRAVSMLGNEFIIVGLENTRWKFGKRNEREEEGPGLLKVSVTDTGCGVLPDNIGYVFDKFSEQIFGNRSAGRLGTTIGLYVTKQLCNRMKGDIKVFSKFDKGTSFIACIPAEHVVVKRLTEVNTTSLSTLSEERRLRAMVVDDMNFNIIVLTNYLQRMKIEVAKTAVDGRDAYEKYVQSVREGVRPDIVTMDVEMPVMNGKEAAQKIREFERENNLKPCFLVMISGNVAESEIKECLWHNGNVLANNFLKKPAIYDDVWRVIVDYFNLGSQNSISTERNL